MDGPKPVPTIGSGYHRLKLVVLRWIGHEVGGVTPSKIERKRSGPPMERKTARPRLSQSNDQDISPSRHFGAQ